VVLVSLPFLIPWTYRASGDFSVEASPPAPVRVQTAGVLDRILVQEGDTVSAGAPIAVLWNPDLELDLLDRTAESRRLSVRRARAQARGELSGAAEASAMLAEVDRELEILRRRRDDLVVRAPIAGIILGYRIDARVGERLEDGDELTSIASLGGRLARIRIPLKRAGELQVGQTAKLRLRTHPNLEFQSTVASVAPAAEDGTVEAIVYFPVGSRQPSPGMTGIGKVVTRRATIAHAISRAWRQTVRIDLWL
jgi:multidrug efflux pump subunit AcrA (membrane-fusion protein)